LVLPLPLPAACAPAMTGLLTSRKPAAISVIDRYLAFCNSRVPRVIARACAATFLQGTEGTVGPGSPDREPRRQ
jgi:hypothetical protein